jgi:hypothetical protein
VKRATVCTDVFGQHISIEIPYLEFSETLFETRKVSCIFVKKTSSGRGSSSSTMKSAFDDEEPYVLTELGKKFVHYVFTDIVPKIE